MTVPFYFHWAHETDRTFDPNTMATVDESIFSFEIKHDEGQHPTLTLTIKNPRVGLLAPGRKVWAWLADTDPANGHIRPLFFGVLVGIPSDLFAEKITLQFIARSPNFIEEKQAVAETMRVRPFYDPIWLDTAHRDEPDAILEGWSALWHIDRTTLQTTASDILIGEDGTVVFAEQDAFYDSVRLQLGEAPLTDIELTAGVHWRQRTMGTINGPDVNIASYTAGSFLSDWPKPGAALGGGWFVESSFVRDVYEVDLTPMAQSKAEYVNRSTNKHDCDTDSSSASSSFPAALWPGTGLTGILTSKSQTGICDPFGGDPFGIGGGGFSDGGGGFSGSDPFDNGASPPVNRPASVNVTGLIVPIWYLNCTWKLRYEAKREFSEELFMRLTANTQPVLTSPLVAQHTEQMKIASVDVGEPLLELDAWSDFAGKPVELTQVVYPNDPTKPGGLSYQICVLAGTAGTTEPVFSDIPGDITIDGGVHWASMGTTPLESAPGWNPASNIPRGEVICYEPTTVVAETGKFEPTGFSFYLLCYQPGQTNSEFTDFTYVPPQVTSDEQTHALTHINFIEGPGAWDNGKFLGLEAGLLGPMLPQAGDQINDGSVVWVFIDNPKLYGIPIGGSVTNVTARNFFPTDRGLQSIEYLICRARARLRLRSRAVKVDWDCPFDLAAGLSARMSATLFDPRMPGGQATGKITSYKLCSHSDGKMYGHVEIGCATGFGEAVTAVGGVPQYTNGTGYCLPGYQRYDGATTVIADDISYEKPTFGAFDDGLSFPLFTFPGKGVISGTSHDQEGPIQKGIAFEAQVAQAEALPGFIEEAASEAASTEGASFSFSISYEAASVFAWTIENMKFYGASHSLAYVMEANPVSYDCVILPVTNGPFNGAYTINVTPLAVPKGIDLEAPSSP